MIRGKEVSITASTINTFYGLSDFDDEHSHFAEQITEDQLDDILSIICVRGTQWDILHERELAQVIEQLWDTEWRQAMSPNRLLYPFVNSFLFLLI